MASLFQNWRRLTSSRINVGARTITSPAFSNLPGLVLKLDTIVVSHVHDEVPYPKTDEADSFIPLPIRKNKQSEDAFDNFLKEVFTGSTYSGVREKIKKRYPSPGRNSYKDQEA